MHKPRVIYYSLLNYREENRNLLDQHFDIVELADPDCDTDDLLAECEGCFAPLGYKFDAEKMDSCQQLQAIITNTTGVPHIDTNAASTRNIHIISLQDEQEFLTTITPTAEHTFGLILALIRHTSAAHQAVLSGSWNRRLFSAPAMLSRMNLGIVGYGRLGKLVGRYGATFGMQVRYFDHMPKQPEPPATAETSLKSLFSWANVISLHLPSTQDTYKIIDQELLGCCQTGSYLVNTARGEILEEAELLKFLKSGHLNGVALDVLDGEFEPGFNILAHPLVQYAQTHDNLILTPHIGGSTRDAWLETERRVIDLAIRYMV